LSKETTQTPTMTGRRARLWLFSLKVGERRSLFRRRSLGGVPDETGNADEDQSLATRRASAVRDELVRRGVDESRITLASPGNAQPGTPGATREGQVELVVTNR
jgi:hypothetical protein